jgi:N-acetylmuramoyl-L-alanine amidase
MGALPGLAIPIRRTEAVSLHCLLLGVLSYCLWPAIATATTYSPVLLHPVGDPAEVLLPSTQNPQAIARFRPNGRLISWRFNAKHYRLEFKTSGGVQPRAQLIGTPTRLVIDLPGIAVGRRAVTQRLGGSFRILRVGQFDRQTARIVVELDPDYTLNPKQVRFRGLNPQHWTVQLPRPRRLQTIQPQPHDWFYSALQPDLMTGYSPDRQNL